LKVLLPSFIQMSTEKLHIEAIPAFEDNYIWLLHNQRDAVVVDPGDAASVIAILNERNLNLQAILITHHHADHIGGVIELQHQYTVTIYAPTYGNYAFKHVAIAVNDTVFLDALQLIFNVLWLPGHTQDHIAYVNAQYLFCGDVLFGAGCGRLLEGTATQMLNSLNQLKKLNSDIKVFCAHEYTAHNINFALTLEPNNLDLQQRKADVKQLRENNVASLPSTIGLEIKTNPFLRCTQPAIIQNSAAEKHDELSVFSKIRTLRNHY